MKAASYSPGGPENLSIADAEIPEPKEAEVRIKVMATALNRADTLQRRGLYNPPEGSSPILGLEAAGVVDKVGPGCPSSVSVGQRVMALLVGGGNAEYVTCRFEQLMPVPPHMSMTEAAAVPEVWLTAFQLLYFVGKLSASDTVLIHAGASGVGTAAVQLARQAGATVLVTAGSQEKIDFAKSLGAAEGFNYKEGSFKDKVLQATDGKGVDLILDCVFGSMFDDDLAVIKMDGRWVVYAFLGGSQKDVNFMPVFRKRVQLLFSNLRFRSVEYKQKLIEEFSKLSTPHFESGSFKPIIHTVLPLSQISDGHRLMESNANMGKIVLTVAHESSEKQEL